MRLHRRFLPARICIVVPSVCNQRSAFSIRITASSAQYQPEKTASPVQQGDRTSRRASPWLTSERSELTLRPRFKVLRSSGLGSLRRRDQTSLPSLRSLCSQVQPPVQVPALAVHDGVRGRARDEDARRSPNFPLAACADVLVLLFRSVHPMGLTASVLRQGNPMPVYAITQEGNRVTAFIESDDDETFEVRFLQLPPSYSAVLTARRLNASRRSRTKAFVPCITTASSSIATFLGLRSVGGVGSPRQSTIIHCSGHSSLTA